jgi:hypothetical protein
MKLSGRRGTGGMPAAKTLAVRTWERTYRCVVMQDKKNDKNMSRKNYFESAKIVFFIQPIKNSIFLRNLVCEHRISRCTPRIFLWIF